MANTDDRSVIEKSARISPSEGNSYVPQQLIEAKELAKSITRRLEDCALEWQAEISRKQWQFFNSTANGGNMPAQSLLARTYFTEKNLDESFQHLLSYNKIFSEYLKNFIDLLRGDISVSNIKVCNVQNLCCNATKNCKVLQNTDTNTAQCSLLDNQYLYREKKIPDNNNNVIAVQNSFTDVIKAKIDFDTKFLGFEAVLHKVISTNNTTCLCEYCSHIMTSPHGKNKRLHVTIREKRQRIKKSKRLSRSARTVSRKRKKRRPPIIITDSAEDQSPLGTSASIC